VKQNESTSVEKNWISLRPFFGIWDVLRLWHGFIFEVTPLTSFFFPPVFQPLHKHVRYAVFWLAPTPSCRNRITVLVAHVQTPEFRKSNTSLGCDRLSCQEDEWVFLVEWYWQGHQKSSEKDFSYRHNIPHKIHKYFSEIKPRPPQSVSRGVLANNNFQVPFHPLHPIWEKRCFCWSFSGFARLSLSD